MCNGINRSNDKQSFLVLIAILALFILCPHENPGTIISICDDKIFEILSLLSPLYNY